MKKDNRQYINKLVSKLLNETLEEKAENLVSKIKSNVNELGGMDDVHPKFGKLNFSKMTDEELEALLNEPTSDSSDEEEMNIEGGEMEEGFDDDFTQFMRGGKDYDPNEFRPVPMGQDFSHLEDDSLSSKESLKRMIKRMEDRKRNKRKPDMEDSDEMMMEGTEVCECGGMMNEGECMECGYQMEGYNVSDLKKSNEFDYVQEEDETMDMSDEIKMDDSESCKYHMDNFGPDDERTQMYCGSLNESLKGRQKVLDKNKNNKIDAEDFKLLRKGKKSETKEGKKSETKKGKKFPDLSGDGKVTRKDILLGRGVKLGKKVKESVELTEDELIDLIESIVLEQKVEGLKTIGKPKGLTTYEKAHKGSGKENDDYLKSVTKKMKDYLKDGSKGEYSTEPKMFPKGNGELAKMSKKAYIPSGAVQDYTDNFTAAALENISYDEIQPNEDWVSDNVKGSSRTGNNPKWANAEDTGVNDKRDEIRKKNLLGKMKKKAYNKAPQPAVIDKAGENEGDKIMAKLESVQPKESKKLNEEFEKMKNLISYDRKTQ